MLFMYTGKQFLKRNAYGNFWDAFEIEALENPIKTVDLSSRKMYYATTQVLKYSYKSNTKYKWTFLESV